MQKSLTQAGLIDFICSQDPARKVQDMGWRTCAVGDYFRSTMGRDVNSGMDIALTRFIDEICVYEDSKERPLWRILRAECTDGPNPGILQRTYGDLQRKLIEAKLVADSIGDW